MTNMMSDDGGDDCDCLMMISMIMVMMCVGSC